MVSIKHHGIEMSLDIEEAQALADVLGFVGGPPEGRRRYIEGILQALTSNGFSGENYSDLNGEIRFE